MARAPAGRQGEAIASTGVVAVLLGDAHVRAVHALAGQHAHVLRQVGAGDGADVAHEQPEGESDEVEAAVHLGVDEASGGGVHAAVGEEDQEYADGCEEADAGETEHDASSTEEQEAEGQPVEARASALPSVEGADEVRHLVTRKR